jgi:hypothetical protein
MEKTLNFNIFFNFALIMKVNSSMERPWIALSESIENVISIKIFEWEKLQNMIFFQNFFLQWIMIKIKILLLHFKDNNIALF